MNPRDLLRLLFPDRQGSRAGTAHPTHPSGTTGQPALSRGGIDRDVDLDPAGVSGADFSGGRGIDGRLPSLPGVCQPPHRISFDRAFDLRGQHRRAVADRITQLLLGWCRPACHSEFLAAFGSVALSNDDCPFCKLVQRYGSDPRVQSSFPAQPLANPSAMQLGMLILLQGTGFEPPTQRYD